MANEHVTGDETYGLADTLQWLAVLYADISGSSRIYEQFGDAVAQRDIVRCLGLLTDVAQAHGGRLERTIGDEVMAVFPDAAAATVAAIDMQNALEGFEPTAGTRLGARIGFHFGPAIERDNDLFGDSVNLAARLSGVAIRGQVITTRSTADRLNPVLRASCRQLHAIAVKGKNEVDICEVLWKDADQTVTVLAGRSQAAAASTLTLRYGAATLLLDASQSSLAFGRDKAAQLVVDDANASRNHGSIEFRSGKFILTDHSVNGTWVTFDGNAEFVLRREECALLGRGWIALGQSRQAAANVMEFECR